MGRVRNLKLIPEIECWPTWVENEESQVFNNFDPYHLAVSQFLASALCEWSDPWDETYDMINDPANPKFPSTDHEQIFWRDGAELADRLRSELGEGWVIEYDPKGAYPSVSADPQP